MTTDTPPSKRARMRRGHTVPEARSLNSTMLRHSGTSLFTLPICWTPLHSQLLGVSFSQQPDQRTPMPANTSSPRRSRRIPPTVLKLQCDLNALLTVEEVRSLPLTKTRALKNILSTLFPSHLSRLKTSADLGLRFGSRCYAKAVKAQAIWKHPESGSSSFDSAATCSGRSASSPTQDHPVLAYISRSHLDHVRRDRSRIPRMPDGSDNGPVQRLHDLRSKNLRPSNMDEDPYFVAAIIALAQQAVYTVDAQSRRTLFIPRDVEVRVITVSEEEECFIVYSTVVPAARIKMFDQPNTAPESPADIHIKHTRVPVWPVLGLKERLGHVLGREVVGDFNKNGMVTYKDELTPCPEKGSTKRRCEILPEALNVSFSEDPNAGSPDHNDNKAKRRRLPKRRVGLVR
ncbi:uncharacterized protein B0I36DRAFT_356118 [Microdochium trichocladiopsis]|uniref:Uncharacterized protein n=1 Tax=Microdochium trichocladiopsis TaxID=1682393 RepID=A0A9P9BLG2_9PEZI|nr:uncharacterized protein B0I36DRAFT_356118 [Microdochium trichocladiopsis]KAH7012759.1 hypothetical protein B0I36DRAFT_356118 [Microdochium trichocladiopsis]